MTEKEISAEYRRLIDSDMEANRLGALALKDNMERSDLYFRDRFVSKTLQIPRIYTKDSIELFRQISKTANGIFIKVMNEYKNHEDYRALFGFSKEAEELILLPTGYDIAVPMARYDIFYHDDTKDYYFCEINTDGSSGMNEDRLQDALIIHNPAHQEMRRRYRMSTMELFDSWVNAFLSIYEKYSGRSSFPDIAIVDFLDNGTLREYEEFLRHFQKAGANCEICDIRDMRYVNGKLYSSSGRVVDAVYRRAVTVDVLNALDQVKPFLDAVRDGACCLIGGFCTQIIHNKMLFYILHHPRTKQILTAEENKFIEDHIPWTMPFRKGFADLQEIIKNKDRYILKPEDSYASHGVYAGVEQTQDEWEEIAAKVYDSAYICQEYCPQHSSENIDFAWGDGEWHSYIDMAGLYVYNGEFAGVYSRAAQGDGIIASNRNERTQATYIAEERN